MAASNHNYNLRSASDAEKTLNENIQTMAHVYEISTDDIKAIIPPNIDANKTPHMYGPNRRDIFTDDYIKLGKLIIKLSDANTNAYPYDMLGYTNITFTLYGYLEFHTKLYTAAMRKYGDEYTNLNIIRRFNINAPIQYYTQIRDGTFIGEVHLQNKWFENQDTPTLHVYWRFLPEDIPTIYGQLVDLLGE